VADRNQFDEYTGFDDIEDLPPACAVCETMLPDAADGLLTASEQRAFDMHVAGCQECARELAEAQRGAAWLSMLKSQAPTPPETLLAKIIAETTGARAQDTAPVAIAAPQWNPPAPVVQPAPVLRPSRRLPDAWTALRNQLRDTFSIESARVTFQPRIAMTAAMAFFSIALTLNLTGVRLRDLRPANFTPSAIKRTVADLDASAIRTFQNNRAVYQVESRLSELRSDDAPGSAGLDAR
jgi:hypothetical protein